MADIDPPDEIARLRAEVARLRAKLDRSGRWNARLRRAGHGLLLVLGCVLVAMSHGLSRSQPRGRTRPRRLRTRGLERLAAAIPASVDDRIPLLQSEGFVKARRAMHALERLSIVLPMLALLCLATHVALSRPRRRGLLRVGLGLTVTALLLLALVGAARSAYLEAIDRDVLPRQAAADIFDALMDLLRTGIRPASCWSTPRWWLPSCC